MTDATPAAARLRVLAAAALFSTGGAAIKACALTSFQVAAFRSGIAAVAILALAPEARRRWTGRTLLVGTVYAATVVLFVLSNKLTTSANAIYLQSTAPLHLLLLGPLLLGERVRRRDVGFMAALALGMSLFFVGVEPAFETAPDPVTGNILAAASGLTWALSVAGLRWLGRSEEGAGGDAPGGAAAAAVAGNVIACAVALPFALPVQAARPLDWGLILFLGVLQIALAYVLLTRAVRHVPALEASLLLLLEPVLNPVWSWIVHGEVPGPWSMAGAGVILAATLVHTWLAARRVAVPASGG